MVRVHESSLYLFSSFPVRLVLDLMAVICHLSSVIHMYDATCVRNGIEHRPEASSFEWDKPLGSCKCGSRHEIRGQCHLCFFELRHSRLRHCLAAAVSQSVDEVVETCEDVMGRWEWE